MQDFREIGATLRNWGRWGDDDERGTVNLITPECIVAASQLVKRGAIFDLGIPFDGNGPQPGGGRINPVRLMSETGAPAGVPRRLPLRRRLRVHAVAVGVAVGRTGSRLLRRSALQRVPVQRRRPARRLHCSIDKLAKGIVGRGVLLDIARLKGVDWLEAG